MIHHASIPARDPHRVATVLAELIGGRVYPFPPLPGAYQVVSGDARGTMLEIYPDGVRLEPTDGIFTPTTPPAYHPFHILLSVPAGRADIERIGAREGWRTDFSVAGYRGQPPAFQLYRMWVENRLLVEFIPDSMVGEYERFMQFARLDAMMETMAPATA
ncbi:MAG: hypothetical protein ACM3N5_07565 [Candidatus Eiseniibacteriota bacterium]